MKKITVDKVIASLEELKERVTVEEKTRLRAKKALDRMVEILPKD
jgi:quinolinate synthase